MAEGGFDVGNVAAVVISLLSMHCFIPALHLQSLYTYIPLYLIYLSTSVCGAQKHDLEPRCASWLTYKKNNQTKNNCHCL